MVTFFFWDTGQINIVKTYFIRSRQYKIGLNGKKISSFWSLWLNITDLKVQHKTLVIHF